MIINDLYREADYIEVGAKYAEGRFIVTCANFSHLFHEVMQSLVDNCKHHANDLLIDIESIREYLDNPADIDGRKDYYIGIRENGVDGITFINNRLSNSLTYGEKPPYKAIYHLVIDGQGLDGAVLRMYEMKSR